MKKLNKYLTIFGLIMAVCLTGCDSNKESNSKDTGNQNDKSVEDTLGGDVITLTAEEIINKFIEAGFPIENVVVFTEETDVNGLLGRPNQYTSKILFADNRIEQFDPENPIGGTVEVFENNEDAKTRAEYIENVGGLAIGFGQYMYLYQNILLRIDYDLSPTKAEEYENALKNLIEGEKIEYIPSAE